MAGKVILTDTNFGLDPIEYRTQITYKGFPKIYGYEGVIIKCSPTPIMGHWIITETPVTNDKPDETYQRNVDLTHKKEELPERIYQYALKYGKKQARERGLEFIDESSRAKESKLAEKTQHQQDNVPDCDQFGGRLGGTATLYFEH